VRFPALVLAPFDGSPVGQRPRLADGQRACSEADVAAPPQCARLLRSQPQALQGDHCGQAVPGGCCGPAELTRADYRDQAREADKADRVLCKRHAAALEGRTWTAPMKDLPPARRNRGKQPEAAGQPA
jgi:hypothetical protein